MKCNRKIVKYGIHYADTDDFTHTHTHTYEETVVSEKKQTV
jgi:hypothetical protein